MHGHPPPRPNACEEKQAWGATKVLREDLRLVESVEVEQTGNVTGRDIFLRLRNDWLKVTQQVGRRGGWSETLGTPQTARCPFPVC